MRATATFRINAIGDHVGFVAIGEREILVAELTIEEAEELIERLGMACAVARGWDG